MKYELICADIDGTLLDSKKRLLPQVKQSLREAAGQGIRIVLASGRMPAGVELVEKELGIECIKICNAGSYTMAGKKCIASEYLSNDIMQAIHFELAEKYGIPLWIFSEEEWFVTGIDEIVKEEIEIVNYTPKLVDVTILAIQWEGEGRRPNKLLFAAEPEIINKIYQDMKRISYPDIGMARSADTFIEIFPKNVNKGNALRAVCSKLGIDLEKTIAFGDHELDLPLIEAAGMGVAMGNAIMQLKEKADYITKTNDEAGIACALDDLLTDKEDSDGKIYSYNT